MFTWNNWSLKGCDSKKKTNQPFVFGIFSDLYFDLGQLKFDNCSDLNFVMKQLNFKRMRFQILITWKSLGTILLKSACQPYSLRTVTTGCLTWTTWTKFRCDSKFEEFPGSHQNNHDLVKHLVTIYVRCCCDLDNWTSTGYLKTLYQLNEFGNKVPSNEIIKKK